MAETRAFSDKEILEMIKEIIGGILMIPANEISADLSLLDDLGMESIDFVDVAFQLEDRFGIAIPRRNPIQRITASFGEEKLVQDRKLTQKGANVLRVAFPEVEPSRIYEGMQEGDIPSLITVQTYVNVVRRSLDIARWQPEQCDQCGARDLALADNDESESSDEDVPPGPVFLCKRCNNRMTAPSFDELLYKQISEQRP